MTDTLVNSGGLEEHYAGFQPVLLIFDQFSPVLSGIFHQKVVQVHLFEQENLFSTKWYTITQEVT